MQMNVKYIDGQQRAWHELKAELRGHADPAKMARIESELAQYEDANQNFMRQQEFERRAILDRLERLETARDPEAAECKAVFDAYCRYGHPEHTPAAVEKWERERKASGMELEQKALIAADDSAGGFLCPPEYLQEIIKAAVQYSPVREIVKVRQTGQRSLQTPKRTGTAAAVWVGESQARSETQNPAYGMTEIPVHEMTAEVYVSFASLEDSAFDLESELTQEFSEQFAVSEGLAVVSGNGVGKPFGFTDPGQGIATTNSGTSGSIASGSGAKGDALITLAHAVKAPYAARGRWVLNRQTLGSVRKLADTQGRYLWEPSPAVGLPSTILGSPYTECPDMPNEAANSLSVGFGDWQRAYVLADRLSMSVLRDPYSQASNGRVKFLARRRVGGQVVVAEAIRLLKCI